MRKKARLFLLSLVLFVSCNEYTPKPTGYSRIDKEYEKRIQIDYPEFSFLYPASIQLMEVNRDAESVSWFNIVYPKYNATIYFTYLPVNKADLPHLLDESYQLAYGHVSKAEGIFQTQYSDSLSQTTGIIYDIKGSVASPLQFYITDNTSNFLRGSLYFNQEIKPDSIAPVIQFIREDIVGMMESLKWKK